MTDPIIVVATIVTSSEHTHEVEAALKTAVAGTVVEPGCEQYALHRDRRDSNRFVMVERWSSQECIDRHANGPVFKALLAALKDHATLQVAFHDRVA